jgi:Mg2+ and Co2+ transporter CorA
MMKSINKIINFIKEKNIMGYEFPLFRVAEIEKDINISKEAAQDGQNDIPRTDSQTFSICENEAIAKCDELRQKEVSNAAKYLASIKDVIMNQAAELGKKHFFLNNLKANIEHTITEAKGKLSPLIGSFKTEQRHVQNYKIEHKISREPHTLTPMSILISLGVIAFLFYFEMELNTRLLAPAMADGQLGGKAVASAVAILNVFVSFGAGYLLIKNIHHVRTLKRRIAQFGLLIYALFIIYLNGLMGAFRASAEAKLKVKKFGKAATDSTVEVATEQGNELLWFLGTVEFGVYPIVLMFVGITFAVASLWDGYLFDDRYPGYGKVGKKRNEDIKEIERLRHALSSEVLLTFRKEIKDSSDNRDRLIKVNVTEWSKNITNLENTFENYKRFATQLDDGIDHCIGEYRGINNKYRKTAEPKYWFDDNGKMRTRYYDLRPEKKDPEKVFPGYASLYLKKDEIDKELQMYQNKITEEANQYLSDVNIYQDEINKIVDEIRSKHEVNINA